MKTVSYVLLWLLAGLEPGFGPTQGNQAQIVIYRQREFAGGSYDIEINDKKTTTLAVNRHFKVGVPAGRVKVQSIRDYFTDNQVLWLDLRAGQTYYVKAVEEVDFLSRTLLLAPVSEAQAQRELRKTKPAQPALTN